MANRFEIPQLGMCSRFLRAVSGRCASPVLATVMTLALSACCIGGRDTAVFYGSADLIPVPGEQTVRGGLDDPGADDGVQSPGAPDESIAPGLPDSWRKAFDSLDSVVYFDFDLARLNSTAVRTLRRWVSNLKRYPNADLTIRGHTDSRGTRDYNLWLAERRAKSIQDYLETRGIEGKRVRVTSYGEEDPAVRGNSDRAHALNRRAVLIPETSKDN